MVHPLLHRRVIDAPGWSRRLEHEVARTEVDNKAIYIYMLNELQARGDASLMNALALSASSVFFKIKDPAQQADLLYFSPTVSPCA